MAARRMVGLVLVLVALFAVVGGFSAGFEGAVRDSPDSPTTDIENETFSSSQDTLITLNECCNHTRVYYENDSVTVYNNSSVVEPAGNYSWFKSNGTLRTTDDTEALNDTSANVTYGYYLPSQEQALARDVTLFAPKRGDLWGIALGAAVLLAGLAYANGARP